MDLMLGQLMTSMQAQLPDDAGARAILLRHLDTMRTSAKSVLGHHIPAMMEAWAQAYAAMFSRRELEDTLAFVSTPSGQHFFEASPSVLADPHLAQANQAYAAELAALMPEQRKSLLDELAAYLAAKASRPDSSAS